MTQIIRLDIDLGKNEFLELLDQIISIIMLILFKFVKSELFRWTTYDIMNGILYCYLNGNILFYRGKRIKSQKNSG